MSGRPRRWAREDLLEICGRMVSGEPLLRISRDLGISQGRAYHMVQDALRHHMLPPSRSTSWGLQDEENLHSLLRAMRTKPTARCRPRGR